MRPTTVKQDYDTWLGKFKPKRTSDDCLTPPGVWEAVAGWVEKRYGVRRSSFLRPFWPGASYESCAYPSDCVVVDNPPFSIISKIVAFYNERGVRYFLFAPYLSNVGIGRGLGCTHVIAPWSVRFENGAEVPVSFVTNLDPEIVAESAPDLLALVKEADKKNRAALNRRLPKFSFPSEVVTSAALGYMATHGTAFQIRRGDCAFIRTLDAGGQIFGGGLLLSPRAAAERAAAERAAARRFALSERETALSESLASIHQNKSTKSGMDSGTENTMKRSRPPLLEKKSAGRGQPPDATVPRTPVRKRNHNPSRLASIHPADALTASTGNRT